MQPRSSPAPSTLRALCGALGILLIAAVPLSLYGGQKLAARRLSASLSRSLGLPVTVDGFWAGLGPYLVIAGLRVGGERPILQVERTEIIFAVRASLRPTVRRLRLLRPILHLTDQRLWRWLEQPAPGPTAAAHPARRSGRALGGVAPELLIEDGALLLQHHWLGRRFSLRAAGISLRPGSPRRLLLGPTQLSVESERVFEAEALALDLDRRWRPGRAALLGGSVHLGSRASLSLHSVTLLPSSGGYRLQGMAKPAGQDTGRLVWRAQLDRWMRPVAPQGFELILRQIALGRAAAALEPLGLRLGKSRLSGQLRLLLEEGLYRIQGRLAASELRLEHPALARQPLGPFAAELLGAAVLDPERGVVRLEDLQVSSAQLTLAVRGELTARAGHTRLSLDARLPPTHCQQVLASIPPGLAPALAGLAVEGRLGISARLRLDSRDLGSTEVDLLPDPLECKVVADPPRADVRRLIEPITIEVTGARGDRVPLVLGPKNPSYRPLGRISAALREAFVVAEDSHFYEHRGFDSKQLRRAFINNLEQGRLARGASTISQQLIKNVFLSHDRTLARKLQEAILTWRLEQVVSKRRILELYLNLVEMGPGVHGVGQAALAYFNEDAGNLGPLQAAKLAALTPSPRHLARRLREGNPGDAMLERVQTLLRLMRRRAAARTAAADRERVSFLPATPGLLQ